METAKIEEGAALYYLTFTVVYWLPVFVAAEPCLIITESLNFCHQHKGLRINGFVIMPTHAHLILPVLATEQASAGDLVRTVLANEN